MSAAAIPEPTTRRLSLYLRILAQLQEAGRSTVSSGAIATCACLKPAQVRKDLAHVGAAGVPGVGYRIEQLRTAIARRLGLDRSRRVVIVGAGNLGSALGNYPGFDRGGFHVVALFDVAEDKIGRRTRSGRPVLPLERLEQVVDREGVEIGIVAVPGPQAQAVVDRLVAAGIRAVLNFAPVRPLVPHGIRIRHVDLRVELESLAHYLAQAAEPAAAGGRGARVAAGRRGAGDDGG